MAHWFHRNPIKTSAPVGYELKTVLSSSATAKICVDLRACRKQLLELLRDANNDTALVEKEVENYCRLMLGFLHSYDEKGGDSKLRHLLEYKWTDSLLGLQPTVCSDTWFDVLSMLIAVAQWHGKRAAKLSGQDQDKIDENTAKEVHKELRVAAGLFEYVRSEIGRLGTDEPTPCSDLDPMVLTAYQTQNTAEAHEVTVARAIELEHKPNLVSALAHECAKMFGEANYSLSTLPVEIVSKWRTYFEMKHYFYLAYAYAYLGESLLAEDKCGEAVRACREGIKCYDKASALCADYNKSAKGVGMSAKCDTHLFFRQFKPIVARHLEKAERENGFIYHQKVPEDVPELTIKATYGLVKPIPFSFPPEGDVWSTRVYAEFNIGKASMPEFAKARREKKALPDPKEAPIYQTDKDMSNKSGCVVS